MARRLRLHEKLCDILGTRNVYFQPPATIKLTYPCIIYKINNRNDLKADDMNYRNFIRYEVILIYREADYEVANDILLEFSRISHERTYTADNLYHDVYTLYF